jgi:hypothetical protein
LEYLLNNIIVQQAIAFFFSAVASCERDDIELYYNNIPFVLVNRTTYFVSRSNIVRA